MKEEQHLKPPLESEFIATESVEIPFDWKKALLTTVSLAAGVLTGIALWSGSVEHDLLQSTHSDTDHIDKSANP